MKKSTPQKKTSKHFEYDTGRSGQETNNKQVNKQNDDKEEKEEEEEKGDVSSAAVCKRTQASHGDKNVGAVKKTKKNCFIQWSKTKYYTPRCVYVFLSFTCSLSKQ